MKRALIIALAAGLSACAPTPVQMPAARASEVLSLFAAGRGPANVCSANGRALLRGAVRAYSREMAQAGVNWPGMLNADGEREELTSVDVSVMIAFAAGFVKAGDFQGAPQIMLNQLALREWPEIRSIRLAARDACEEVVALQQAAASFVVESTRYREMTSRERSGRGDAERLRRQSVRTQRAHQRMQDRAAVVQARMQEHAL
jgi:hypothetical protein